MKEYRIVIRKSDRKLYCFPTKFESCDIKGRQIFWDDRDLEAIWKSDYRYLGQCNNRVAVEDRNGFIAYFVPEIYEPLN